MTDRWTHTLLNKMSTGNVLPGMWKIGTLPKNAANLSESIVAEVTISFKSVRRATTWEGTEQRSYEMRTFELNV